MKTRAGLTPPITRTLVALLVTAACNEPVIQPNPSPAAIVLDLDELTFAAQRGLYDPELATVTVTNGGEQALTGLSAAVHYADPDAPTWLEVGFDRTTAPAQLSVQARVDALDPGTHEAEVIVSAGGTGASTRVVPVTLTLEAAPGPWVALSEHTVVLAARATEARPDLVEIEITNEGPGILGGLGTEVRYAEGEEHPYWLSWGLPDRRAPGTLGITARTDIPPGRHTAELVVSSHTGLNRPVISVTYDLLEAGPTIESEADHLDFILTSESPLASRDIQVLRSGGDTLVGLEVTEVQYGTNQPAGWLTASVAADGRASFDVDGSALSPGLYVAQAKLSSDDTYHEVAVDIRLSLDNGAPDFVPEAPLSTGSVALVGGSLDLDEFHISNQGTGPGRLYGHFFLSEDAHFDADDISLWGCAPFGTVEAGGRHETVWNSLPIRTTVPAGIYHVGFVANCDAQVLESDATNNVLFASTPVVITEPPPATLTARAEPAEGGRVIASPDGPTYRAFTEVRLEAIPSPGYRFVRFRSSSYDSVKVATAFGTQEFVAEFAALEDLADLTIEGALAGAASVPAGELLDVSAVSVVNIGSAPSRYAEHRYYLSQDRHITTDDIPIGYGGGHGSPSLAPGASDVIDPGSILVPYSVTPGRYYLGMVTDFTYDDEPEEGTLESDESNNAMASVSTIEVLPPLTHTLTTGVDGIGGIVEVDPVLTEYPTGTYVLLTAVPDQGYELVEWVGHRRKDESVGVQVMSDTTVLARFGIMTPSLQASLEDGTVDVSWTFEWRCTVRARAGCLVPPGDHFELEEAMAHSGPYTVILTSDDTHATSYGRQFRRPPGTYYYRVRALGSDWTSPYSWPVAVTVPGPDG